MTEKGELARGEGPDAGGVDLSIIIVSYNTRDVLARALASIRKADLEGLHAETIVVDNACPEDSAGMVRESFPEVRVIETGLNGGYAYGVNAGLAESRGRFLLVLNPDAELHPRALRRAVAHLQRAPEVGILGCRAMLETGEQQSTLFRLPRLRHLLWNIVVPNSVIRRSARFGDQRYASLSRDEVHDVEVVAGCFMMLPRRVYATVGGMDDRIFLYSEETEWCARIGQAGWRMRYDPDVEILHSGAASTGQSSPWKDVEMARGRLLFFRITRGSAVQWLAAATMLTRDLLRTGWFVALAAAGDSGAGAGWRARMRFLARSLVRLPRGRHSVPPARSEVS